MFVWCDIRTHVYCGSTILKSSKSLNDKGHKTKIPPTRFARPYSMKSTLNERLSLLPKLAYEHVYRAAGKSDANDELDYSTLSVAVTTLGLILLVELIRHKLEVNAVGRPFFSTVLEGVYRECKYRAFVCC